MGILVVPKFRRYFWGWLSSDLSRNFGKYPSML